MKRIHRIVVASLVGSALAGLAGPSPVAAQPIQATAQSRLVWTHDPRTASGRCGQGQFSLGQNTATVGPNSTVDPAMGALQRDYAEGMPTVAASLSSVTGFGTMMNVANATSKMTISAKDANDCFPWKLQLDAFAVHIPRLGMTAIPITEAASAIALGGDPQTFLEPGVYGALFSLDVGSSLFETRPEMDVAHADFRLTAFGLPSTSLLPAGTIASITLDVVAGQVVADVRFNPDSRLQFFDPANPMSAISDSTVKARLEGAALLGTIDGLTSALPLFLYQYDLTNTTLPANAFWGAEGRSIAVSPALVIPEPSTLALLGAGLLGLLGCRRRRLRAV